MFLSDHRGQSKAFELIMRAVIQDISMMKTSVINISSFCITDKKAAGKIAQHIDVVLFDLQSHIFTQAVFHPETLSLQLILVKVFYAAGYIHCILQLAVTFKLSTG